MSKLSRRALVATAATLPALGLPALAADAFGPSHPDAELLRLGVELESLESEWLTQQRIDRKHSAAHEAACEAAGLPRKSFDSFHATNIDERRQQAMAYREKRAAVWYEGKDEDEADVGKDGVSIAWKNIHDRLWPLIDAIREQQPRTLAGLAVLTRASALAIDGDGDLDTQTYLDAVSRFLGIQTADAVLRAETRT